MAVALACGSSARHGWQDGSGSSRNARVSCTRVLLFGGGRSLVRFRRETFEESLDEDARPQQLGECREVGAGRHPSRAVALSIRQVGPLGRHPEATAVRKNHKQMQTVVPL